MQCLGGPPCSVSVDRRPDHELVAAVLLKGLDGVERVQDGFGGHGGEARGEACGRTAPEVKQGRTDEQPKCRFKAEHLQEVK